jgi:hypothetical protein
MHRFRSLIAVSLLTATALHGQKVVAPSPDDALVKRALAAEVRAAQDMQHPMRYHLRKSTPRLTSTKIIFETKDGAVARLIAINDKPLSAEDERKEQDRLNQLVSDPSRQWHRKQSEDEDTRRVTKVLRALPDAFVYQFVESIDGPTGKVDRFSFNPNPHYSPPDLETQVLKGMAGEIWIDKAQERVTRLEGRLQQDVDIGWGILGRLSQGGWIVIEQSDVADHQWRTVHFKLMMSGRVLFRTKVFDTVQDESHFAPLSVGLSYQEAVRMMRADSQNSTQASQ